MKHAASELWRVIKKIGFIIQVISIICMTILWGFEVGKLVRAESLAQADTVIMTVKHVIFVLAMPFITSYFIYKWLDKYNNKRNEK